MRCHSVSPGTGRVPDTGNRCTESLSTKAMVTSFPPLTSPTSYCGQSSTTRWILFGVSDSDVTLMGTMVRFMSSDAPSSLCAS